MRFYGHATSSPVLIRPTAFILFAVVVLSQKSSSIYLLCSVIATLLLSSFIGFFTSFCRIFIYSPQGLLKLFKVKTRVTIFWCLIFIFVFCTIRSLIQVMISDVSWLI